VNRPGSCGAASWYLLRLPVHVVKIDQSFISLIGHPLEGAAIVAAVTKLARCWPHWTNPPPDQRQALRSRQVASIWSDCVGVGGPGAGDAFT
jgi:hypothetical protein